MHLVTPIQIFNAMSKFLEKYYYETNSDDIGSLLSSMQFLHNGEPIDTALWNDWMEIIGGKALFSAEEGFEAMKAFLQNFYKYPPSNEITNLLQSLQKADDNKAQSAIWKTWTQSIDEASTQSKECIKLVK